jgi:hypothetical protein
MIGNKYKIKRLENRLLGNNCLHTYENQGNMLIICTCRDIGRGVFVDLIVVYSTAIINKLKSYFRVHI